MKLIAAVALLALAGCAEVPIQQRIANASTMDLCRASLYAPADVAMLARAEAEYRNVNCNDYAAAVMQDEQNRRAAAAAILLQRQAQPPALLPVQPYQPPQRTVCTTQRIGNELQTVCN